MLFNTVTVLKSVMVRDSKTHVLRGVDTILLLVEDHLSKTQTMMCSPYVEPIEQKLTVRYLCLVDRATDEAQKTYIF